MYASILPNHAICMAVSTSPGRPRATQRLGMSVLDQQSQLGFECDLGVKNLGKPTSHSFITLGSIQLRWILARFLVHVQTTPMFCKVALQEFPTRATALLEFVASQKAEDWRRTAFHQTRCGVTIPGRLTTLTFKGSPERCQDLSVGRLPSNSKGF